MAPETNFMRAAAALHERQRLRGIVADRELVVTAVVGELARDVRAGQSLCDAVLPLHGMDAEIRDLIDQPERELEVPNISVVTTEAPARRLNYLVFWDGDAAALMVVIVRSPATDEVTIELQRQVRRRMLAEAELAAQAQAIEAANRVLAQANRDLADFARIVSHDLKSPMRAMRYFADDLERALDDPSQSSDPKQHLERLRRQSTRMASMLTGLLDYSRIETRSAAVGQVDTRALVDRIVDTVFRPAGIKVSVEGTWPTFETPEVPLDLIIRNLVDNAIKHHDRDDGQVVVRGRIEGACLVIEVEDDGPGIDTRHHDAIFRPYAQLPDTGGGSIGMGLTIARRAAQSADATLTVISRSGATRGTIFELRWPYSILTTP